MRPKLNFTPYIHCSHCLWMALPVAQGESPGASLTPSSPSCSISHSPNLTSCSFHLQNVSWIFISILSILSPSLDFPSGLLKQPFLSMVYLPRLWPLPPFSPGHTAPRVAFQNATLVIPNIPNAPISMLQCLPFALRKMTKFLTQFPKHTRSDLSGFIACLLLHFLCFDCRHLPQPYICLLQGFCTRCL